MNALNILKFIKKNKRVSYYQMSVDNGPFFRQKSSGIIVCTGREIFHLVYNTIWTN